MVAMNESGPNSTRTEHNLVRGIWQLLRFHTFEGLSTASVGWRRWPQLIAALGLALFLYAIEQRISLAALETAIFGILASYGITHGVFCMWNDICDRKVDGLVTRTKNRPLPSGMVTYGEAMLAFVVGLLLSIAVTYTALGQAVTVTMVPIWALSFIYPFAKRAIWTPQIILGLTMAACVFPPWIAIGNDWSSLGLPVRLFAAVFCWLVYLDIIYACQDRLDDEKAGVKSMAVLLGDNLKLGLAILGLLQITFLASVAYEASVSTFFWVFGLGVWAISIPWSVLSLNLQDRHSGGRIFLRNAVLVIYLSAIAAGEVWFASGSWP